jgi:hypothetical protein
MLRHEEAERTKPLQTIITTTNAVSRAKGGLDFHGA